MDITTLSNHNYVSSEIAKSVLFKNGYAHDKIYKVRQCILTHTSPIQIGNGKAEEVCLSNADAIAQIVNPTYWLYLVYKIQNLSFNKGRLWNLSRINSKWN